MTRVAWNKTVLDHSKKTILRKMFFQKKTAREITKEIGISYSVCNRLYNKYNWYKKRERYYRYLCYLAYKQGISVVDICCIAGCNYRYASYVKRKYKVATKRFVYNKRMTKELEKKIVCDYIGGIPSRKLSKKYGFKTGKTVTDVLRKYGIKFRHPSKITHYNESCFKKIDSHEKAYILGFFLTDGYVIKDYKGVAIQLTISDRYILEKMVKIFGISSTVINIDCSKKRKEFSKLSKKVARERMIFNSKDMARLSVYNQQISHDMRSYGCIKDKTYKLECPLIPKKYHSSFSRGVWDGDGTVGIAKNGNIWCQFVTVSEKFAYGFIDRIKTPSILVLQNPCKDNKYTVRVSGGNKRTIRFLRWMYKDKGDLYLRRKYEKIKDQIN